MNWPRSRPRAWETLRSDQPKGPSIPGWCHRRRHRPVYQQHPYPYARPKSSRRERLVSVFSHHRTCESASGGQVKQIFPISRGRGPSLPGPALWRSGLATSVLKTSWAISLSEQSTVTTEIKSIILCRVLPLLLGHTRSRPPVPRPHIHQDLFLYSTTARIKSRNKGFGRLGREVNSGWN